MENFAVFSRVTFRNCICLQMKPQKRFVHRSPDMTAAGGSNLENWVDAEITKWIQFLFAKSDVIVVSSWYHIFLEVNEN